MLFENHSNEVAEKLSKELTTFPEVASNTKGVLSYALQAKSISPNIVKKKPQHGSLWDYIFCFFVY